ncbi:MAG TPA: WD40 repeat domain-containing protein [Stenomitos sp.]
MADNPISIKVSAQVLKFRPGGPPASFEVTVDNDSDRFASFQLEIVAAGADSAPNFRWYTLSPEVSSKKPPGDSTKFLVTITDTPVPGFAGMMNLTVRVFSLELRDEERQVLRLYVQEGTGSKPLKIDLPVRKFQAAPGSQVEIPVRLLNPNQQTTDVILSFLGVEPSWLLKGAEQRLQLDPGEQTEVIFYCQPPDAIAQSPCNIYPFTIEATHHKGTVVRDQGTLEVLPTGYLDFNCTPQQQTIPAKGSKRFRRRTEPVAYELQFENASNLCSSASVQIQGKDWQKCKLEVIPPETELRPGETSKAVLLVSKPRPRWGIREKLLLEVTAILSDRRLDLRNDTQTLELRVLPVIPFALQVLGGLLLLLLLFLLFRPFEGHTAAVTSVRFNGLADRVISGSSDQTIRRWNVQGNHLKPMGVFARTGKAVRVVRFKPVNNDIIAAGLENGEIQLWDVLGNRKEPLEFFFNERDDRVLDLEFTKDSRYLFSSHGSGLILAWDLEGDPSNAMSDRKMPLAKLKSDFAVYDLAVVGTGGTNLAIGGRYNRLVVWDIKSNQIRRVPYQPGDQNSYIQSLAVAADQPNLMATADNQGNITLWDMRQCLAKDTKCEILDEWSTGHGGKPVRAVNLSKDGCYLASAGDDGREMLWPLTRDGKRDLKFLNGRKLDQFPTKINDVNLILRGDDILVVSGSDDHGVRLRRVEKSNTGCR